MCNSVKYVYINKSSCVTQQTKCLRANYEMGLILKNETLVHLVLSKNNHCLTLLAIRINITLQQCLSKYQQFYRT